MVMMFEYDLKQTEPRSYLESIIARQESYHCHWQQKMITLSEFWSNLLWTTFQFFSWFTVTGISQENKIHMLNSPEWTHKIFLFQTQTEFTKNRQWKSGMSEVKLLFLTLSIWRLWFRLGFPLIVSYFSSLIFVLG